MTQIFTARIDDGGRFLTFEPHRLPNSGGVEDPVELVLDEEPATCIGEVFEIDATNLLSESSFATL